MAAKLTRARMATISPDRPQWNLVRPLALALRRGELVVIPTDTLYGLAADPFNRRAVRNLFRVKKRPETRPILLLIDSIQQLSNLVEPPPAVFHELAARFWPGPLTMILKASPRVPLEVTAGTGTVAVRLPAARLTRTLIRAVGRPITGTSANLSGWPAATTAAEAYRQLGSRVPYIIDGGPSPSLEPSTIVDLSGGNPKIVRKGVISADRLRPYLQ